MSDGLQFNEETARKVEALYLTPNVVAQRGQVLGALKLRQGERVLDIGSGPGLLASEMAALVGRNGYEYLADIRQALAELYRVTHPGGRVVVLDSDYGSLVIHTENEARMERVLGAWNEHFVHAGLPRTLSRQLRDAGFRVREREAIPMFNPEYRENTFAKGALDLMANFAVGRRGVSREEAEDWLAEFVELEKEGKVFLQPQSLFVCCGESCVYRLRQFNPVGIAMPGRVGLFASAPRHQTESRANWPRSCYPKEDSDRAIGRCRGNTDDRSGADGDCGRNRSDGAPYYRHATGFFGARRVRRRARQRRVPAQGGCRTVRERAGGCAPRRYPRHPYAGRSPA